MGNKMIILARFVCRVFVELKKWLVILIANKITFGRAHNKHKYLIAK